MKWQQVREQYPNKWLLLEAVDPQITENQWIVNDMLVLHSFDGGQIAFKTYGDWQQKYPKRDLFIFHSSRENIEIGVRQPHYLRRAA